MSREILDNEQIVTRFAPSPSGRLHIGHAYSALFAAEACGPNGRSLLRIEDIDQGRCRPEFEDGILEDLAWLGFEWEAPVWRQSDHMADYAAVLDYLDRDGLLFPCFCTRKDLQQESANATTAPHGPDGPRYPSTCRSLSRMQAEDRMAAGEAYALRLNVTAAARRVGSLSFHDQGLGEVTVDAASCGDVVLARKDVATSYHLAVTLDDAVQGVNLVTRGEDLLHATHVHRVLQALLDLPVPTYHHHALLRDPSGRRYAKRDLAETIQTLREAGCTPEAVREMATPQGGLK
jgi:glutamyl-Q tRNA(Asp) synthetase